MECFMEHVMVTNVIIMDLIKHFCSTILVFMILMGLSYRKDIY